jgi:UrcA family protein
MNTELHLPRRLSSSHIAIRTAILIALFAGAPFAIADQQAATAPNTGVARVSLADLDLWTPEGIRAARDRLSTMAQRLCAELADNRDLSNQPDSIACTDDALAGALRQINASSFEAVTRVAKVSLVDLDLSTPEGMRAGRDRLHTIARRLCAQLAHSGSLSYQPNFAACVDDTLAAALRQANALAAARKSRAESRTAQRIAPQSPSQRCARCY